MRMRQRKTPSDIHLKIGLMRFLRYAGGYYDIAIINFFTQIEYRSKRKNRHKYSCQMRKLT